MQYPDLLSIRQELQTLPGIEPDEVRKMIEPFALTIFQEISGGSQALYRQILRQIFVELYNFPLMGSIEDQKLAQSNFVARLNGMVTLPI